MERSGHSFAVIVPDHRVCLTEPREETVVAIGRPWLWDIGSDRLVSPTSMEEETMVLLISSRNDLG